MTLATELMAWVVMVVPPVGRGTFFGDASRGRTAKQSAVGGLFLRKERVGQAFRPGRRAGGRTTLARDFSCWKNNAPPFDSPRKRSSSLAPSLTNAKPRFRGVHLWRRGESNPRAMNDGLRVIQGVDR